MAEYPAKRNISPNLLKTIRLHRISPLPIEHSFIFQKFEKIMQLNFQFNCIVYIVSRWNSLNYLELYIAMIFLHSNVCVFRHYFLTTDYQSSKPSNLSEQHRSVHRKAIKYIWLYVCVCVCVCCRDVKGFADETNEITKQLIFQNHQQTVRDFTCSPLTRISSFFFSFVILIRYFFSSLFFHSVCSFLFRANAARSVQYKWMNARYRRRRGRMNRQWQRNYTDKMSDRERYRA